MKNVEMSVEGNILTIKVDLTKEFGHSSSGKTTIIASSEGNVELSDKVSNGSEGVYMGLNVYKRQTNLQFSEAQQAPKSKQLKLTPNNLKVQC